MSKKIVLACLVILIQLLVFSLVAIALEKPIGSISGRVTLEKEGFQLQFADFRHSKAYVTATGPRGQEDERGVWVNPDGRFRIDHLPQGEYTLKIHANGYATDYLYNVFVEDGKISDAKKPIRLTIIHPSISIASNRKVFTSQEKPYFWINCYGSNKAKIKLYKVDMLKLMHDARQEKAAIKKAKGTDDQDPNEDDNSNPSSIYSAIDFSDDFNLNKVYNTTNKPKFLAKQKPIEVLDRNIEVGQEDWANLQFKLNKPLPYGDYIGLAEAKNAGGDSEWDIFWFNVSDTGLIVKMDNQELVAQAVDLNTLKPVDKVSIDINYKDGSSYLRNLTTGKDGTVNTSLRNLSTKENGNRLLTIAHDGKSQTYGGLWFYNNRQSEKYRTYFYTERPIYRLGQTVYFKAMTRSLDADGFHTPKAGLRVKAIIEDPNNNQVWQGSFRTNEYGSFNGLYNIPEEASTGAYQISFQFPGGDSSYNGFEVAQYRKPEYEVTVSAGQPRIIAGQKLQAKIKAKYYFGAPVANAQIKYSVYANSDDASRYRYMPRPAYYSYFDDWSSDDGDEPGFGTYSGGGDYITEGTAQTDNNGEAIIEVDTKKPAPLTNNPYAADFSDKIYKVEAEITDLSRMSVVGSGTCNVSVGNSLIFAEAKNSVIKAGQPIQVNLTAKNYENQVVPNEQIKVILARWIWNREDDTRSQLKIEGEQSTVTDKQGTATISFAGKDSMRSDSYVLIAQADDGLGNTIYDTASVWVANQSYPYLLSSDEAKKETLQIKLDKFAYQAGDKATAIITAPLTGKEGVKALVSIEGAKIHKWWVLPINAAATTVEFPIDSTFAPNVYLSASLIGVNHQFYKNSRIVRVSPKEHFLNVAITPGKEIYGPGDLASYEIKATYLDGKPAANTELSFGLVDESIYAIRSEVASDIQKFFYDKRENRVVTTCTFGEEYSGGPDKIGIAPTKIRKDFRDTAIWLPNLYTNSAGIATASLKLPDNLTTWRATVRAINKGTDVGASINKIIATKDLIVRLSLPRFYSVGDESYINAVVHNYTKEKQPVKLLLSTSPQFAISEKMEQQLNIDPDKVANYAWPVKLVSSGPGTVTIKALGKTSSDAMESTINVASLGVPEFLVKSGELLDDPSSTELPSVANAKISSGSFKRGLSIAASSIAPVIGNYDKLIDYPYGCTEQTMSRLMPSVIAFRLHKELGVPLGFKERKMFDKVYKRSMKKLEDYHHGDGGWGWWKNDQSNMYLTALVLDGFYQLKNANYPVSNSLIKDACKWLSDNSQELYKQLTNPKIVYDSEETKLEIERELNSDLAKSCYTLALFKVKSDKRVTEWLLQHTNNLTPEALSYLSMALKLNQDKRYDSPYQRLLSLANHVDNYVDWDHTKALLEKMGIKERRWYSDYTYRYTGTETTALALRAVLVVEPKNTELIEPIKIWLLTQRDNNGWTNTKTTAQVFLALLEEQIAFNNEHANSAQVKISLANKLLQELKYEGANCFKAEDKIDLDKYEKGTVKLDKSGPGRIYFNSLITYIRQLTANENIAADGNPKGLSVERSFYRLKPGTKTSDNKIHFGSELITDKTVQAGETVLMKVTVNSPIRLPYMILEAYLPSGAEIVHDQSKEDLVEDSNQDDNLVGDWSPRWWSHEDVLDDRIVFFSSDLPQGKSEFSTLVRLEMPGDYQINPLRLEGMYAKNVRAYSNLDTLRVTK